jgi:N-acetylglucosamine kinase-like BadF-type ATPase
LKTGYNIGTNTYLGSGTSEFNYVGIKQQGPGLQTTKIELLNASNNIISVDQSGSANHTFNLTSAASTSNINNTITATQSGSAAKEFTLNMNGSNGAQVTVQQTNPTQANTGSMTIQCTTCGSYSYIRQ